MKNTRVIIVGAGPAGTACAWKLKQHQVDFILMDKAVFPRVKPCAGWITPQVLKELELNPADYPGGLTHFDRFNISIKNIHFTLRTDQYAIRRVELDNWLVQRAGANFIHHAVQNIVYLDRRYIVDDEYSADFIVGAGGTHCPVARAFFTDQLSKCKGSLIVAMEEEFPYDHTDQTCHLWFLQNGLPGYAWYVPKTKAIVNVGVGGIEAGLKTNKDSLVRHWALLVDKLERMRLVMDHQYKPLGHSYFRRGKDHVVRRDNAFIAGDAVGLATVDMGEGIGPAVLSGMRAAESILNGSDYSVKAITKYSFPSILGSR
jgi:flavin-dependent dehydrogenase